MRTAVLIDRFARGRGGAEEWLGRFAAAAAERGDEVVLATRDRSDPTGGAPFAGWTCVATGPGPRWMRDRAFGRAAHDAARAAGADATLAVRHVVACDVAQPHGGVHRAALEGVEASLTPAARRARRAARVVSPKQRTLLELERRLLEGGARRVVALSRRVLRDLERWFPAAAERAVVIPPGVDLERFVPVDREPPTAGGPVRALFLARNARLKGLRPLLAAVARVRRDGVDLRLTAAGGFRAGPWQARAERLGIGDAVTFPGAADDPRPLYAAADLLAHPTFYDPCSLVVLEAWATGLPVVTTTANGAAEWARRGSAAVVERADDEERLAAALAEAAGLAAAPGTRNAARASAEAAGGVERLLEILELLRVSASA